MKLIILDRDGVINFDSAAYIKSPAEWKPIPGSPEAIARLNQAGYRVVVATNQSGVGRSLFDMDTLNAIHEKMHKTVAAAGGRIDAVFYCPHAPDEGCHCRKPEPGLLEQIAQRYGLSSLAGVPYIGDSLRDMQAAAAAGCAPHLVCTGRHTDLLGQTEAPADFPPGTRVHADLAACVEHRSYVVACGRFSASTGNMDHL